ncbi:hypothetical protein N7490_006703 [Penicillium lividum]|nr:hypothetical protein N7490_006525 [Penicillium lividum]KAJ5642617.1 hypothetical protein N7490_006617 [Penicillium lividum]KAJ5642703.1 hypothetical protein N7490_006703 [Penicillium lividum]
MFLIAILVIAYARSSFGSALEVIDYDGQCVMWSNDNYGCTGYSASFGLLDGDECSNFSEVINGTRQDKSVLNVDACGTENGEPAAWIQVNKTGLVTFSNQNGDESTCTLNNGFNVGSWCSASNSGGVSSTKSPAPTTTASVGNTFSTTASTTATPVASTSSPIVPTSATSVVTSLSTITPATSTLSTPANGCSVVE